MGGVSIILFGMISAVGARTIVDAHLDFFSFKKLNYCITNTCFGIAINKTNVWNTVSVSGLAMAALVGIVLNKILPEDV